MIHKSYNYYDLIELMDFMGCAICILCLICSCIIYSGQVSNRKRFSYYVQAFLVTGIILGADGQCCILRGQTSPLARFFYRLDFILTFMGSAILSMIFFRYFLGEVEGKLKRILLKFPDLFLIVFVLILFLNRFNGWYYSIDEQNCFHRGPFFDEASALFALITVLYVVLLILYRRQLTKWKFNMLLLIAVILALFMGFQYFISKVSFLYMSYLFSTVCLFCSMQRDVTDRLIADERIRKEQELKLINTQLNPHVLFNALTAIQGVEGNPKETIDGIYAFGKYLRVHINALTQVTQVSFQEEIRCIRQFAELEHLRFGDRFSIRFELGAVDFFLPQMSLLAIVETMVGKGFSPGREGGSLLIKSRAGEMFYYILVSDREIGEKYRKTRLRLEEKDGETLLCFDNVKKKLEYQCQGQMRIQSFEDGSTVITLIIPRKH